MYSRRGEYDIFDFFLFYLVYQPIACAKRRTTYEKELLCLIAQNSEYAFAVILDHYRKRVYGTALRMLRDPVPDRQKQIYGLSRVQGMTMDEIAQTLSISRNTAKDHLKANFE